MPGSWLGQHGHLHLHEAVQGTLPVDDIGGSNDDLLIELFAHEAKSADLGVGSPSNEIHHAALDYQTDPSS